MNTLTLAVPPSYGINWTEHLARLTRVVLVHAPSIATALSWFAALAVVAGVAAFMYALLRDRRPGSPLAAGDLRMILEAIGVAAVMTAMLLSSIRVGAQAAGAWAARTVDAGRMAIDDAAAPTPSPWLAAATLVWMTATMIAVLYAVTLPAGAVLLIALRERRLDALLVKLQRYGLPETAALRTRADTLGGHVDPTLQRVRRAAAIDGQWPGDALRRCAVCCMWIAGLSVAAAAWALPLADSSADLRSDLLLSLVAVLGAAAAVIFIARTSGSREQSAAGSARVGAAISMRLASGSIEAGSATADRHTTMRGNGK